MMRRALLSGLLAAALATAAWAADWNKIFYVGGTVPVRTGGYDWNTQLTVTAEVIVVTIESATVFSHSQTVRISTAQVVSIWSGALAWRKVSEVPGAHVPSKPPSLFGMMADSTQESSIGIIYEQPGGKRGALLLESFYTPFILIRLKEVTGKVMEK
jgi:hypothetical protein